MKNFVNISIKQDGLNIKKHTATITLQIKNCRGNKYYGNDTPQKELKALAILLGGYNQYGMSLSVLEYSDFRERFEDLLIDVVEKLEEKNNHLQPAK